MRMYFPLIVCTCFASMLLATGCVAIPKASQNLLALQTAEAQMAQPLAQHLKKVATDAQLKEATRLYNNAAVANNAVVVGLVDKLAIPATITLNVSRDLSLKATEALRGFRAYAQQVGNLPNLDPNEKARVPSVKKAITPAAVATAFLIAKELVDWWLAENKRQRESLQEHLKSKKLPPWHEIK